MFAFPGMLVTYAKAAGMSVSANPDRRFTNERYPHFAVFCAAQLGQPIRSLDDVQENANIIAGLSEEEVKRATLLDLIQRGFHVTT